MQYRLCLRGFRARLAVGEVSPSRFRLPTPRARGVEVAGRATGGNAELRATREGKGGALGKAPQLREMPDVAEAWLSLWCRTPRVSEMYQVKP
jgi:hypothetical protein